MDVNYRIAGVHKKKGAVEVVPEVRCMNMCDMTSSL